MPKTAFVILFSNVTVLFPWVTHNTFPLSLAHIVKTGTQRAENTTFYLQCIMPIQWINDSTWLSASFLSSALACVEPTRTWICDCWILVPFICTFHWSAGSFFSIRQTVASKFTSALLFGLLNWLQKSWESEFNLQAEQVDCTAVLGQETRKSRKCLMNYHEHNKPEERKSHKWEQLGLPESHVIIRRRNEDFESNYTVFLSSIEIPVAWCMHVTYKISQKHTVGFTENRRQWKWWGILVPIPCDCSICHFSTFEV